MKSRLLYGITLLAICLTATSQSAIGEEIERHTNAKRITRVHQAQYDGTPAKVFPLLCPVVEYDWLENWQAEIVYTDSGVAELDNIFKTFFKRGETEVWTVTRYEKNKLIEFIIMNHDRVTRFSITLKDNGDGTTNSIWTQIQTALTAKGEAELNALTEEAYARRHENISMRLNYYLKHGKMYKSPKP